MSSIRDHPWYQKALPKHNCKCSFCKNAIEMDLKDPEYLHTMAGNRIELLIETNDVLDFITKNASMVTLDHTKENVNALLERIVEEDPGTIPKTALDQLTNRLDTLLF